MNKMHQRMFAMLMGVLILTSMACSSSQLFTKDIERVEVQPQKWAVDIIDAEKSKEFGTWSYEETEDGEFMILTIHYKNVSNERQAFAPESAVILFPEDSEYDGSAILCKEYQTGNSSHVVYFANDGGFFLYVEPGEERTDHFAWEIREMDEVNFELIFPETCAIPFHITE
jgi:hypothetical protein